MTRKAAANAAVSLIALVASPCLLAEVPDGPPVFGDPLAIDNPFLPFEPGAVKVYRGSEDGEKKVVTEIYLSETRAFAFGGASVCARILREVEFLDGELQEVSYDFLAQADDGAVYSFGQLNYEYEDGEVVAHEDSWLVGGPGPDDPPGTLTADKPCVLMPAAPEIGDVFKPADLYPYLDETVTVVKFIDQMRTEAGDYEDVMKVDVRSRLDETARASRVWYAEGVGVIRSDDEGERLELVAASYQVPAEDT